MAMRARHEETLKIHGKAGFTARLPLTLSLSYPEGVEYDIAPKRSLSPGAIKSGLRETKQTQPQSSHNLDGPHVLTRVRSAFHHQNRA